MNHLLPFITHHWVLVAAVAVVFVALIVEELRSKGALGSGLSAQALIQKINRDNALPLDVRSEELFKAGHIVGAFNLPEAQFATQLKKLNPNKHRPIVLICEQGIRSPKLSKQVKEAGFETFILSGGMHAWTKANMPVVT